MADVTAVRFEEMEPLFDGIARRARATLGVTAWGMQLMTLPPNWDGYPNHRHDASMEEANQEEVYIPIAGSGRLHADDTTVELNPGMMVRVGPKQPPQDRARPRRSAVRRARRRPRQLRPVAVVAARRPSPDARGRLTG